jgi:ubiquinol-cytochrome c reductase cytochrome b subunit
MKAFLSWLENRTGLHRLIYDLLYQNIPGGARWRYVWGSTVLFALAMQFITGFFLWMNYSASTQSAWESVYYIQNELSGGWLLRGLHHFTAQFLTVLLVLHLFQAVIWQAYRAPREINFWSGLVLLMLVLLMALSGYQLPWDQKGFGATKVAMNLMGIVPIVGEKMQRILIGGADYGHLTLTRFLAVHAGLLPAAIILTLVLQAWLLRRHGVAGDNSGRGTDARFWPDQALRNAVACLAFLAAILILTLRVGAPLGAPADPSEPFSAARPEWSFLFMFQFLKQFPGTTEIWGAVIIPTIVMVMIFLIPFTGRSQRGHRFNVGFLVFLVCGAGLLTWMALSSDARNQDYQRAVAAAARDGARVKELARAKGIPAAGALALLKADPFTQGPILFARNCASCHRFEGHDGTGRSVTNAQSASELSGFGSREWIGRLLDPARVGDLNHFGGTKFKDGKMVRFVTRKVAVYKPEEKEQLKKVIAAVSAEAGLKSQTDVDARDAAMIVEGRSLLKDAMVCTDCHQFREPDENATAPDLTGYASRDWLVRFIRNPGHAGFYGDRNDRMPAFGEKQVLSEESIGLIADWLRGDWSGDTSTK